MFTDPPRRLEAGRFLNQIYSSLIEEPYGLFRNNQVPNGAIPQAIAYLRNQIADLVMENALETPREIRDVRIANVIMQCPLSYTVGSEPAEMSTNLFNSRHLNTAVARAQRLEPGQREIVIWVSTARFRFHYNAILTYLDWRLFGLQGDFDAPAVDPNKDVKEHISLAAGVIHNSLQGPLTAIKGSSQAIAQTCADLNNATQALNATNQGTNTILTNVSAQIQNMSNAPATSSGSSSTSSRTTPAPGMVAFNPDVLPPAVRARYMNHISGGLITSTMIRPFLQRRNGALVRFHGDNEHYYQHAMTYLITADGSMFDMTKPIDQKGLMRDPVYCRKDDFSGIRSWYPNFAQHCNDHGFYVHPLWAFRPERPGPHGFTCGDVNSEQHDLPQRMQLQIDRMKNGIWKLLSKKDMFPSNSKYPQMVVRAQGDGYRALKSILFRAHPAFMDQPSIMVRTIPKQGPSTTVLEYYHYFKDYLQLRAFVQNINVGLDDASTMDIFISNLQHAGYINRVYMQQSVDPANAHRWKEDRIVETIERWLARPGSPALIKPRTPVTAPTQSVMIQSVAVDDHSGETENFHDAVEEVQEDVWEESLDDIVTESEEEEGTRIHYIAAVRALKTQPQAAFTGTCLVCRGAHNFDACPVLQNTEFLKKHYINTCKNLRKHNADRQVAFQGQAGQLPINRVGTSTSGTRAPTRTRRFVPQTRNTRPSFKQPNYHEINDVVEYDEVDFQTGRL